MIEIRSAAREETHALIDLLLNAFSDKFSYIFNNEFEKAREIFIKYYETMSEEELDTHYVAVEDAIILGAMQLKYKNVVKNTGTVSFTEMVRKLGIFRGLSATAALAMLDFDEYNPDSCYVSFLAVVPESRGKGIGTKLLCHASDFAKSKNLSLLSLQVVGSNIRATKLYKRLGFQIKKQENSLTTRLFLGFTEYAYMEKKI